MTPYITFAVGLAVGTIIVLIGTRLDVSHAHQKGYVAGVLQAQQAAQQRILAAFNDGKAQGTREATPKHDPKGRFTKK